MILNARHSPSPPAASLPVGTPKPSRNGSPPNKPKSLSGQAALPHLPNRRLSKGVDLQRRTPARHQPARPDRRRDRAHHTLVEKGLVSKCELAASSSSPASPQRSSWRSPSKLPQPADSASVTAAYSAPTGHHSDSAPSASPPPTAQSHSTAASTPRHLPRSTEP